MKKHNKVFRSLALVTQLGISMLTPILLCTLLGVFIGDKTGVSLIIPLFILGAAAGFRNCYILVKNAMKEDQKDED